MYWSNVTEFKIPVSVLVVIYTADLQVLLMERADAPGFWQSVTGSQEAGETLTQTALREVFEETGLDASICAIGKLKHATKSIRAGDTVMRPGSHTIPSMYSACAWLNRNR